MVPGLPALREEDLEEERATRLSQTLDHYAFRLFLCRAIQQWEGFAPEETTQHLKRPQSRKYAESLIELGLAERIARGRYRLLRAAKSFEGTLEWYVARELRRRLGFDVAAGVKFHARGAGGDLDVIAAAEGKLPYLELKSSPPKNLSVGETVAFFDRVYVLRPDVTLFCRGHRAAPARQGSAHARNGTGASPGWNPGQPTPHRGGALGADTPSLRSEGKVDLMANIGRALAEGLVALSPLI